ncbi:hypothetical protein PTSG_04356 [Salpingoeca rosetta]|uniref:Anaphase-promoting complex subunit 10 n=1 Tax=Salpingoeca rosetta (strain ATCC 50818 / BSB-021) TaxID=946362 RepID=F2U8B3_SALR5|nr:uncharacterized protein PTSG_04356 [Salpingoeca rosetta]EGD72621.1 hypothetical protein PTSG_04356 [Salpingoeca rosetta]|eukprot:XP_004994444.1 hypothetical protein PTSG_04356 [Salpingoeca rosetta]
MSDEDESVEGVGEEEEEEEMSEDCQYMDEGDLPRDIGDSGVWTLSSCKAGFGIQQLRDPSTTIYWQSDGPQPHLVTIEFLQRTALASFSIYVDSTLDESYTPKTLSVRVGSHHHDLREVKVVNLQAAVQGWRNITLATPTKGYRKVFVLQVAIIANHQNGRDTHLRALRVHPPEQDKPINQGSILNTSNFMDFSSTIR